MQVDLLIENGLLVVPRSGSFRGCIGIAGEKIVGIYGSSDGISAREKIDARGNPILPGLLDPHVHYGLYGSLEDHFETETASAATGGITTVIPFYRDYKPPAGLYENFPSLRAMGERNAHVDFSIHLGLVRWDQLTNLQKYMNEYGVTSFKFYAAYRGEEAKAIGMLGNETDDAFLLEGFSAVAKFPGAVACIHAENIEIILRLMKKFREEGRDGLRVWSECRPNLSEAETVYRAIAFAGASGCPLYVVHLSARESLEEVNRARLRGQKVFVETCPQYLTLTMDSPIGLIGKVNPPLRSSEDIDALWKAISEGSVDTIGTDHCAPLREVKSGSIWEARPGFPGSATMLPILLSEGLHKRGIPLERIAELTSYNAARIFNLYPRKGTIQVGSDADLCIVDLNLVKKVEAKRLHSRSDFSVHEGWTLKGWPVLTMVRGKVVMRDGEIVGPRGHGRFIEPCFM